MKTESPAVAEIDLRRSEPTVILPADAPAIDREAQTTAAGDGPDPSAASPSADRLAESRHPAVASDDDRWRSFAAEPIQTDLVSRVAVRTFDLTVSVFGLLLLAPLLLGVGLAVRLDSPGPVIYGSPRLGRHKVRFKAWKFRSMRPDADCALAELLDTDAEAREEFRVFHKLRDDPRLTRVGAFIRRTSLDELPQLVNILLGQMSVVGPRPNLELDAAAFGPALEVVVQVKPGLTGLWQVSGRNRLPVEDRVALDLDYARNRTFGGDLRICVATVIQLGVQLLRPGRHGAY